jgi:hypothetical protein
MVQTRMAQGAMPPSSYAQDMGWGVQVATAGGRGAARRGEERGAMNNTNSLFRSLAAERRGARTVPVRVLAE